MALPKQIQRQVKQSRELEQAIRDAQRNPDAPEPSPQEEIDSLLAEVQGADAPPAPAAPPPTPEAPPSNVTELHPKAPERNDWKQKYTVLRGKYDAEVPRLTRELERANERLGKLEELLSKREDPAPPAAAAAPPATFTQEEIDEYGADLLDVIGRKAREIVSGEYAPQITALKQEIQNLEQQLGSTSQRVRKQEQNEVFAVLDREVKDWRRINQDPEFKDWLGQPDQYSGHTRERLLLEAFNANDARRVKRFFEGFIKEHAAVSPEPTDPPAARTAPAGATLDLGEYVAPGTPRGGGQSGAPRERRTWTRAEIRRFYSDVQKGHYRDRPDDKARIEADIVDATNTGRVTG